MELELVDRNEELVLENIIEVYGHQLLRYCHNIMCDYHEAEDVVQIVFLKVYNNRNSFKGTSSFSSWIYKIAYNTCIDHIRKRKLLFFSINDNISGKDTDNFITERTLYVLKKLKPRDRALLYSKIIEEKPYSELANIYNVSEATLRKRYERAKKKFVKYYNQWGDN